MPITKGTLPVSADQVLLGDAHLDRAQRELLRQRSQEAPAIAAHATDARVLAGQLD
jgi:hypothetical protein